MLPICNVNWKIIDIYITYEDEITIRWENLKTYNRLIFLLGQPAKKEVVFLTTEQRNATEV